MKALTCLELGGACDTVFHANTFEEIAEQSSLHGRDMSEKNDAAHIAAMEHMKQTMKDESAMHQWMKEKKQAFANAPDTDK